ncbi:MAG: hypothetical protein F2667_04455, partial [Actinobacteria bacterium]|nr:hypothetical protein [Actinomycetota bacterium]
MTELRAVARVEEDRLLAVGLADLLDQPVQLGELPLVLEKRHDPAERLARRLHLVRGVQEPQAQHHHAEQFD